MNLMPLQLLFQKMEEANARKAAREKRRLEAELVQASAASS
jgi:hypothetical protein